jgi:hypothetical protein
VAEPRKSHRSGRTERCTQKQLADIDLQQNNAELPSLNRATESHRPEESRNTVEIAKEGSVPGEQVRSPFSLSEFCFIETRNSIVRSLGLIRSLVPAGVSIDCVSRSPNRAHQSSSASFCESQPCERPTMKWQRNSFNREVRLHPSANTAFVRIFSDLSELSWVVHFKSFLWKRFQSNI